MTVHKLTAGSGYDCLTRQVAALDETEKGHTGLASYYTERGEAPGVWIGSGMDGIDGLAVGDPVTAEQMRALLAAVCIRWPSCGSSNWKDPTSPCGTFRTWRGRGPRSRSSITICARSGSRWPSASRRSTPPSDRRPMPRSRRLTGPGCALRWHGSSSPPSMAGSQSMPRSWRGRLPRTRGHEPRRSPVMT
jgi:hypothetical protein